MILFFGTRTGKEKQMALQGLSCPFCHCKGTLKASVIPHYVHLFWLPVYRLQPFKQVSCSHCKKVYTGQELNPEMNQALAEME